VNWDEMSGGWKQVKGEARVKWGRLTDDDLDTIEGSRDKLVGKLQEVYGRTREQAEREADEFVHSLE